MVDDGSTDGTTATAWRPPRAARDGASSGAERTCRGRNRGVEHASGRVLAFTDADCSPARAWLRPGRCGARGRRAGPGGGSSRSSRRSRMPFDHTLWVSEDDGLYQCASLFVRRDVFERVGGFRGLASGAPRQAARARTSGSVGGAVARGRRRLRRAGAGRITRCSGAARSYVAERLPPRLLPVRWPPRCRSCGVRSCTAATSSRRPRRRSTWPWWGRCGPAFVGGCPGASRGALRRVPGPPCGASGEGAPRLSPPSSWSPMLSGSPRLVAGSIRSRTAVL